MRLTGRVDAVELGLQAAASNLRAAVEVALQRLELAVPVDQPPANQSRHRGRAGPRQRQQDRQHAEQADQRRPVRVDVGRIGERDAHAVGFRRQRLQDDRQLARLVDDAGLVCDLELRVAAARKLAGAIEQHGVAVLVEARLGVVDDGMGEQGHERRLHVRAHDQGDRGRQQRDVVGGQQRIELDRPLAQHDLAQRREAVGVGVRLAG